ncbi:protein lingerer isoform X1 [Folsomia candida]|uniref:protein lingerer isoform X1 n=1 Tax=Folsomia candida TaxID=158441 RepID=UPI001605551D|nr:protein lingerer isoform X1 [Folsomia candida]XP_035703148.1 protein lingerer isoform X1 [Folsomia candida]
MPSPSPSVPQPTGNILVNGASSSGSKLPVTTTSGGFITNGIRTIIPSSAGTHSLQNGITRIVTPQGVQFPIGSIPQSNVLQNVVRTGLSGINNILSTGGVTPGIRQATLGTLISGVGANSVAAGSSGANIISSLPPGAGPAMTVNNSGGGATPGQAGQNQTVVLSKGTGVTTMTSTGTIGLSQNPSGGASANNNNVTNNQGQPITLGPGGAGGLQILNMNNLNAARAVNVGAVNSGGTTTHQIVAAGPAGSKNLAPRMIISPQVLNTRPGQPGVDEYQSEFSEFLVPNCKSLSPPNANNGGIIVEEGEDESLSTNCNVIIDTVNGNSPTRIIDYTDQSGQDLGSPTTIRSPQSQSPSSKEPFSQPSTHDVPPCLNVAPHSPRPVVIQSSNNNNDADECGALEDQQNHDVTIVEVVLAHEKQNISCNSRNSNSTNTKYLTEKVSNIAVVDKMNASNDKDDIAFETSSDNGDPESHGDIIYARGEGSQEDSEDVKVLNLEGSPSKVQSKGEEGDESNTSFTAETKHHEENETSGVGSVEGGDNDNANSNFHDDECPIQQRYENPSDNFSDLLFTAPQSSPTKPINRNDEFYPNSSDGDSSTTSIIVHDTPSLAPHSSSISNTNTDKDGVPKKECFYAIGIPRRSSSSSVSSGRDSSPSHSINNIASSDRAAKVSPICHQQEGAFVQPQQHSSGGLSRQTSQEMQFGEIGTHYNVDRNDPTAPGGIFTTDPTLQSQFLHYSQINPVTASVLAPAPVGTFRSEDNNSNNSYAVHTPVIRSNQVAPSTPPSSIKNYNSQSSPKVVDTYTGRNNPVQQHSAYEQDYQGGLTAPSARRLLWSSSSSSQGNLGTLNSSNSGGQLPLSSCEYALNSYDAQSQINTSPSTRMPHHQEYNTYVSRSHQSIPPVPDLSGSFAQQQCHVMGRSSHNTTAPCQSQVPPNRWMSITSGDEGASHITTSNTLGSPSSSSGTQRRTNITEPTPFYNPSHHHHSQPTAHIPRPPYYGTQSLAQRPPPGHHHNMPMNVVRNSVPTNVQISQPPRRRMPSDCVYIDNNQKPSSSSVPTHSSLPPNMTSPYNNNPSAAGSVVVDHSQMPHNTDGFWPVGNHPQQHQQQPQQTVLPNPSYRNQPSSMQNVQQYYPPSHQQQSSKQSSGANYVSNMPNQSGASSSYSHPIVCRVPPIRYNRYPGQATENYPSQQHGLPPQMRYSAGSGGSSNISQQGASNRGSSSGSNSFMRGTVANSSMVTPRPPYNMGYPPRSSPYYPHSLPPNNSGQSFKPQYYEGGGGGGGGESFQGGYSSNFSSCQHDELRRLRPSVVGMASMSMPPQQMYSPQVPQAYSPTFVSASNTANTVSTMTAETAKVKCKNFLSFLLELSAKQNQQVSRNVKALIQGLVDGKVNEENFSDRLQKEVNSQPQPCLVGFLKKSLPHLRHSLATNELKIDGIKPPPLSSVVSPAPVTALIPQHAQIRTPTNHSPPVRIITPINPNSTATPPYAAPVMPSIGTNSSLSFPTTRTTPAPPSTQSKMPSTGKTAKGKSSSSASSSSSTTSSPNSTSGPSKPIASKSSAKDKDKKSFGSSAYSGDDDINDVAAMGGVNLAEESQKILGSTEFVGTQIRSVRDETFLHSIPLQARLKAIAAKHGLAEPPPEVAAIISHATEERLKNLIEKLAVIAEHRLDVIKMDDRYEVTQDVKGQLRFLEELEKLERKRHDEQEREMLIRAAKSRSKSEDPEQAKLKAKAKEMQRVAMEEMRQREANQTALEAIGPRKKPKLDSQSGSQSTISQSPLGGVSASGNRGPQMGMRPRLKRVNTRDLLFLLEQEKETSRSHFLYKNLLK